MEVNLTTVLIAISAATLVGLSKTGVPGLGLLVVPIMALVYPAKESVGALVLLLICGDCFAVAYYRKFAHVDQLFRLAPWVLVGIAVGGIVLSRLNNVALKPLLGILVLCLLALESIRRTKAFRHVRPNAAATALLGILAGCSTTIGNAAGPVMGIYFVMLNLEKRHFMGTVAWFFFLVNLSKVPVFLYLDVITARSFLPLIWTVPFVVGGAIAGRRFLNLIPQGLFEILVLFLSGLAAIWLLVV